MTQTMEAPARTSNTAGWVVTLAGLGVNLILGVLYAWSMMGRALATMYPPLGPNKPDPRNWSQTEAAAPFAVGTAVFALTMIFAGRVQDKIGPRWVAVLGGLCLGLGLIASGFVQTPLYMMLTFGVLGGMGIGLGYSATTPAAIKWFPPARKGLITGLVVSGVGLAAVYMAPLTDYLLRATGGPQVVALKTKVDPVTQKVNVLMEKLPQFQDPWLGISQTFLILGVGTIAVVCFLALFLKNPPAGYKPPAMSAAGPARPVATVRPDRNWPQMLSTGQFYLLWFMFILASAPGLMLIANGRQIADLQAPGWKAGFALVMTLALFNTLGRVLSGYVSDRIGRTNTMVLFFLLQAINMFLFARYQGSNMLLFGAAFTGLCYGTIFTLMPAATADFYGVKNLGVNYGILFTAFGVAGVVGSMLGGRVCDLFGRYDKAYLAVGCMLVLATVLAVCTRPPRSSEPGV